MKLKIEIENMSCNICEDDYGYINGCGCSYLMCESCSGKVCNENDKCPQCSKSIRTPYFLSGKINLRNLRNGPEYRLIVYDDKETIKKITTGGGVACSKHGIINLHSTEQLIKYSDFVNINKSLPMRPINKLISITGPCIFINKGIECQHGGVELRVNGRDLNSTGMRGLYRDISMITQIVEKRNKEMIEKCRVFSLKVNSENDCFCSFSEWGYALSLNKILVLDIDKRNPLLKEYYMYAIQSLNSFDKLHFTRKNAIIKYHPELECNDYNSYKKCMMNIISSK